MQEQKYQFTELDKKIFSRLAKKGYQPQVIFDVGASNGCWSTIINEVFPNSQYHLFEPLVNYVSDYQSVMESILIIHPNFTLHPYALGDKSTDVVMNVFDDPVGSTSLSIDSTGLQTKEIAVKRLTIEDAIESLQIPCPQVIKIDTQGSELAILKGASNILHKVDVLLLETWLYQGYGVNTPLWTDLATWLLQFDFHLWDIADSYRNEEGILTSMDCFFVNANSVLTPSWYYPVKK